MDEALDLIQLPIDERLLQRQYIETGGRASSCKTLPSCCACTSSARRFLFAVMLQLALSIISLLPMVKHLLYRQIGHQVSEGLTRGMTKNGFVCACATCQAHYTIILSFVMRQAALTAFCSQIERFVC
jgi:hypothetical protein